METIPMPLRCPPVKRFIESPWRAPAWRSGPSLPRSNLAKGSGSVYAEDGNGISDPAKRVCGGVKRRIRRMKRPQPLPYRPKAIHPVGFCGGLKAFILTFAARRAGKRAARAIDGQPAPQYGGMDKSTADRMRNEVSATYEGQQYEFSIHGLYCRRKSD
jgi:hypothetical protein